MITFNDIKMSDEKSTVYIPRRLRDCFCDFLKNKCPDVQYDTISRWEIPGSDFETARNDFYSKHSGMFAGTEYEDYTRGMYVGFVSNIDTEYLLDLLFETGYISETVYKPLQNQCGTIRRMLISSINTVKKNDK